LGKTHRPNLPKLLLIRDRVRQQTNGRHAIGRVGHTEGTGSTVSRRIPSRGL